MRHSRKWNHEHRNLRIFLLLLLILLAGCAPEEKTLLLTAEPSSEEEVESPDSSRDFTVKKIYTYSYETKGELERSAFLQGCDENEIHIIALEDSEEDETLSYRQVDYRYGFYDTLGDFFRVWEHWSNPFGGEMESDLYIDRLLPSPDGRQLLIYIQSAFWDRLIVCLYTLGAQEPVLLYEGTADIDGSLKGSFSSSGRWVTFDVFGASTGITHLVPVYDCRQEPDTVLTWNLPETSSLLTAPNQVLYAERESLTNDSLWDAALCDDGDQAGLICLTKEADSTVSATRITLSEHTAVPGDYLLKERAVDYTYQSSYLYDYEEMPFAQYKVSKDGNDIDYLAAPFHLCNIDMSSFSIPNDPKDFDSYVWDFLRLDTEDLLVVLVQDAGNLSRQSQKKLVLTGTNSEDDAEYLYHQKSYSLPVALQEYWGIRSADLYLYPGGETEGHLLYKNLQNLIHMEYDDQNSRILLETYEGDDLSRRKCIILEL